MPQDASRHHGIRLISDGFAPCEVMLEIAGCLSTWQFNALHRLRRKDAENPSENPDPTPGSKNVSQCGEEKTQSFSISIWTRGV